MKLQLPAYCEELFRPHRYKALYGGRGGAKSWSVARVLLHLASIQPLRILCARELQLSLQDSVHKLLSDQIDSLGLNQAFDVLQSSIRGKNGSEFIFSGIKSDPGKIKSMEGIDIAWIEEAAKVSDESWQILIPTIRKAGSEIWATWNTATVEDPTHKRFVISPPPGSLVLKVGWEDNPWISDELLAEKDYLYSVDAEAAEHIWGGLPLKYASANVLQGKYRLQNFTPNPDWLGPFQGADWGFASDPSVLVRCWVDDHNKALYIEHEAYDHAVETDHLPQLFDAVPNAKTYITRGDCSRPETISHMVRHGYSNVVACHKWMGSVEDGVSYLRHFREIIVHPRCKHTFDECRLWSFKVDKQTLLPLTDLKSGNDHAMDALRYALEPLILGYVKREFPREHILNEMMRNKQSQGDWDPFASKS